MPRACVAEALIYTPVLMKQNVIDTIKNKGMLSDT